MTRLVELADRVERARLCQLTHEAMDAPGCRNSCATSRISVSYALILTSLLDEVNLTPEYAVT